jgi:acetyl esterase/lipase
MALACLGAAALRLISPGESLARTPWPTSLTVHVAKGVRLAVAEAAERDGAAAGVAVAARLTRLIVNELLVYPARMVPFAIRTWRYRAHAATLEPVAPELAGDTTTAPTGVKPKTLELYGDGVGDGSLVLFVHGGSWGQGAPWQYALLSRRLLDAGASRVGVVQYALFPAADVDEMVRDVEAALEWGRAQQEAARRDGRPLRVVLAAQSAGAHLCSLLQARLRLARTRTLTLALTLILTLTLT